ncbi:MAG TPA: response regulator transcription factor [Planosporangium sp.]|nr:response regulator transcription factor [Planosporangium sp.]
MGDIRVLLVDDHSLFAETLAVRLRRESDLEVLPPVGDVSRALARLRALSPDVVLLDLLLGAESGLSVLDEIQSSHPASSVVVLTGVSSADQVVDAVRRGARAWLPKTVDASHLIRVIHGVFNGESWIPPEFLGYVLRQFTALRSESTERLDPLSVLTVRERDVLQCAVDGLSRMETARRLYLSPNTVRTHTQNILGKLATHSMLETVSLARRYGMRPRNLDRHYNEG